MYSILPLLKRLRGKTKQTQQQANSSLNSAERQKYFNTFTEKPLWKLKLYMRLHNVIYKTLTALNIGEEMIVVAKKMS